MGLLIADLSYPPIPIWEIGPLRLSLHGLFAAVGFLGGAWLMLREVRRRGFDYEKAASMLTWALVGAVLGMRLFTVPAHWTDPGYGWSDVVDLAGDYSILGGMAGGIGAAVLRARMLGLPVLALFDMAALGLALGTIVGRLGDIAIVEHLGSRTSFFLGYRLEPDYDVSPQHDLLERLCSQDGLCGPWHHTALYDMLGAAVLLGVLFWLRRHWTGRRYGQMFALWVIWYGLQRFAIDFARLGAAEDGTVADSVMGPFTGSQWGALAGALAGVGLMWWLRNAEQVSPAGDEARGAVMDSAAEG